MPSELYMEKKCEERSEKSKKDMKVSDVYEDMWLCEEERKIKDKENSVNCEGEPMICKFVWSIGMVSKWNSERDWLIILIYIYICSLINWDRRKKWWSIVNWFHNQYRWIKVEEIIHWILGVKVI